MQVSYTIKKLSKRPALPKRPRLGNTWQDADWRRKLVSATRYNALAALLASRHVSTTADTSGQIPR